VRSPDISIVSPLSRRDLSISAILLLAAAWDLRNVDPEQAKQAYMQAMDDYARLQQNPDATPQLLQEIMQRGQQAELAMRARGILMDAKRRCEAAAKKVGPPIDEDVTADVAAMVASMRGASAKVSAADPPPNFSTMSDQDFRAYKAQFGF